MKLWYVLKLVITSQPRDWTQVLHIAGGFFTIWATREAFKYCSE